MKDFTVHKPELNLNYSREAKEKKERGTEKLPVIIQVVQQKF